MKLTLLCAVFFIESIPVSNLLAQGQFQWGNALAGPGGITISPTYGVDPNNPTETRTGNTATGSPPGTQTYAGPLLAGTGFTAGIYVGLTAAEVMANNTTPQVNGTSSFRTGAGAGRTAGGGLTAEVYGIPPGTPDVHYQFRAWDNMAGTVTSWSQVMAAGGTIPGGVSDVYILTPTPALIGFLGVTTDIRSFQLTVVPEPSLLALGLGALLLRRRR